MGFARPLASPGFSTADQGNPADPSSGAPSAALIPFVQATTLPAAQDVLDDAQPFTDVASATTTSIGGVASNKVRITGTTTITGLGTIGTGIRRLVRFAGALTLTHHATALILPGGASITTAADDTAEFVSLGSGNWLCVWYKKASGLAVAASFSALSGVLGAAQSGSVASSFIPSQYAIPLSAVNFNSANTDNAIPITLPGGCTRFLVNAVRVHGADGTLNVATAGLYTAAAAGGTEIVPATGFTITTASEGTDDNSQNWGPIGGQNTRSYAVATVPNIYFRIITAQGSARVANVTLQIIPIP